MAASNRIEFKRQTHTHIHTHSQKYYDHLLSGHWEFFGRGVAVVKPQFGFVIRRSQEQTLTTRSAQRAQRRGKKARKFKFENKNKLKK